MVYKNEHIISASSQWGILNTLFLLFLPVVFVYSQNLSYKQFTIEDGLPSNQIYDIHQDQDGFIWFATENGLSRYNGEDFINYTLFDGLPDTEIIGFFQDSKNRLWFRSLNGKIGFYKNGVFHNEDNTHFLKDAFLKNTIRNIAEDGLGNLYFSYHKLMIKITPQNELIKFEAPIHNKGMVVDKKGQIYIAREIIDDSLSLIKIPEMILTPLNTINLDNQNKYKLFYSKIIDFSKIHPLSQSLKKSFKANKNDFVLQKDSVYWFSSPTTPLQILEKNEEGALELIYSVDKLSLTKGIIDREKYIWYGSHGKGVFRFDKSNTKVYRLGDHLKGESLSSLYIDKFTKKIYCGTSNGILNVISKDNIQTINVEHQLKANPRIRDIEKDKFNKIWLVCDLFMLAYDHKSLQPDSLITANIHMGAPKDITFDETNNQLLIANNSWTYAYDYQPNQVENMKILHHKRSTFVHIDIEGQLWSGTSKGLFYFPKNADSKEYRSIEDIDEPISCINHVGNTVIAGTKGKGLILVNGDSIRRITSDLGLPSNLIRSIYVAEDESVWVATNQGLCKIQDIHQSNLSIRVINEPYVLKGFLS